MTYQKDAKSHEDYAKHNSNRKLLQEQMQSFHKELQGLVSTPINITNLKQTALVGSSLISRINEQFLNQEKAIALLETIAITDQLTQLLNRRGFEKNLGKELNRYTKPTVSGTLILIDLDKFKRVNDTFGHAAGDAVLQKVSRLLAESTNKIDHIGRIGGDEFAIILPKTNIKKALKKFQRINSILNSSHVNWFGSVIPIQASCGICDYSSNSNITEILHKADDALYLSKKNHQKFNNAQELTTSITNKKRDKSANTPESTTYH